MSEYVISCGSCADIDKAHFQKRNIKYICFHYFLDEKEYIDDLGESMPLSDFYQAMVDGAMTHTSQINVQEYIDFFEQFLKAGKDIIHIALGSGISGTYNSALLAKEQLDEKYPDRKLYVIDSLGASAGIGLLVDRMADLRFTGMDIDALAGWVERHKLEVNHWFFSSDLTFYIRGGRISKTAGMIGNALNICPFLNVDHEGKLIVRDKIRTKKKAMRAMVKKMAALAENGTAYNKSCYISHSACYDDARAVANMIEETFPKLKGHVEIYDIGTTIGSHTGPGTIALFFWGEKRVD